MTLSIRFPSYERATLATPLQAIVEAAIAAGGITTNLGIQPYDPDSED